MDIYVIRNGAKYAGQTWWDGKTARWDGPDPYALRYGLSIPHLFTPLDPSVGGPDLKADIMPEERMISSFADLGVIVRLALDQGADVETVHGVDSAPVDPRETPRGKRLRKAPPVPQGGLHAGVQRV